MTSIAKYLLTSAALIILLGMQTGCKKYLEEKPLKSFAVPRSLSDLQTVLDNHTVMNERGSFLGELAADNYFLTTGDWQAQMVDDRLNYIWDGTATYLNSWTVPYQGPIYYANVVLDNLQPIAEKEKNNKLANAIKGTAVFYRSFAWLQLAQLYCLPYAIANQQAPGLPLLITAAIEQTAVRSTVQQTYDKIISDLKLATDLLPETTTHPTRPTRGAAYGALARTYLSMREYAKAGQYADSCLKRNSTLMDFNGLVPVGTPPIRRFNAETIFYNRTFSSGMLDNARAKIDTALIDLYDDNDLRKTVFFKPADGGYMVFQGSYDGDYVPYIPFDGIITSEVWLIRAECLARAGNKDAALTALNGLLKKRWKNDGSFEDITATDAADALRKILTERRKELVYRGLRWSDLRRFNLEGEGITLKRVVNGTTYTLPPNDPRWVMLIPPDVIKYSGMPQNPR